MSLKGIAKETLDILAAGGYVGPGGARVEFGAEQRAAVAGTALYTPEQGAALLDGLGGGTSSGGAPRIAVTAESTQAAAARLVLGEGVADLALLSFASARNPGGGFITGARAQEEDLARSSGIYPCLLTQPAYYDANRAQSSLLYTDHVIYSPGVPWFRTRNRELLERMFLASVITAPAPNSGEVRRRDPAAGPAIEAALRRRAGIVLAVARERGHRTLLLGAWGCGVFRNDPVMVADAFGDWLERPQFRGCFDRVEFAIYDSSADRGTLRAFQERFPPHLPGQP
ncbi:MAG TPA: TIGR02452 family protein [Herpetosiphonaceae bacterium]|nr:TIGR02452 family protein [Herpetosiphonaceae bacterium]